MGVVNCYLYVARRIGCRLLCGRSGDGGISIKRMQQYVEGVRREGG
jgi:hypothetical protein